MVIIKTYGKQIIFIIDYIIILLSSAIIFLIILFGGSRSVLDIRLIFFNTIILLLCISLCQYFLKTYNNIWRYAGSKEYIRLIMGVWLGYFIYSFINQWCLPNKTSPIFGVAVCSTACLIMLLVRFFYGIYRMRFRKVLNTKVPMAIIGAGSIGVRLMEDINRNPESGYEVKCFYDDNKEKIGKNIHGIKVLGPIKNINSLMENNSIEEVIIAIPSLTYDKKCEIINSIMKSGIHVKVLPDLLSILRNSEKNLLASARDFNVDDLLGRESVLFDKKEIDQFLNNKIIMVTGGGGSIGSELCRQIALSNPSQLIIIDNYENNAYDIQQELIYEYKDQINLAVEIASVQDKDKIELLFERYRPQIVFHVAAHKHVPFMEHCPDEVIKNNIFGTYNTVHTANKWKVQKFVLISTDKAVNPTSMMGASKRMCEMIILSMKNISETDYVAVRFGNVLGSNGSIIPLFKRQIEQGGPVTITDRRAYRYFMTIQEAAQLVLRAGSMASNSEIYVLDMGKSVNILTLAENLIRLLGRIPYSEIPIIEIGLRPGEKLNEELLMQEGELVRTENQKIFIERQKEIPPLEIEEKIEISRKALETKELDIIRQSIQKIVPTFKSLE